MVFKGEVVLVQLIHFDIVDLYGYNTPRMNEEQMLRISREIDAVISGDVKPPSKKKNLPAFVTHLGLAGLTFAGLSFGSGLAKASESQTRPVPTETPTPGLTPTVTPTPEIAVSTELSATSPIEFDFVSNVETDAQEFIKPDITQTIASPAFRKQPGTSSEYVDEQKQRFTPGTYLEVLDIPDEKLTKEQREQKEKTGIAPRETETKDGWIWEYVKTVSNVNGSSSPEGTGYVAREKVDGTSDLTAHISYNTLPDSVKNQLESEEERYKKLEVPGQDEGLGYNLTSLPEQYVGIGGNEGVITKALELWDIPSSEQEEFIKQSEAFIKASAEDPSFAFKRYLAGVLEALKKEELIPGLTLIASTETGFTEEKFGMYAVRTENGIILLTSRLGDKHILATSLNQTVGTDGITSFNVGRFSALFPANIQSLIEQTITETDKPDEARLRFDTIYRSLPVASQTAQLDSGKLTLDPVTEPESVQLLTGLSLGIYLEKLATIAPQAPSEEGDTVTYTYNEDKGVYEAEVVSSGENTPKYYTYTSTEDGGEWEESFYITDPETGKEILRNNNEELFISLQEGKPHGSFDKDFIERNDNIEDKSEKYDFGDTFVTAAEGQIIIPIGGLHGFSEEDARLLQSAIDEGRQMSDKFKQLIAESPHFRYVANTSGKLQRLIEGKYDAATTPDFVRVENNIIGAYNKEGTYPFVFGIDFDWNGVKDEIVGFNLDSLADIQGTLAHEGARIAQANATSQKTGGADIYPTIRELERQVYEDLKLSTNDPNKQRTFDFIYQLSEDLYY